MSLADLDSDLIAADLVAPPDAGRQIAERVEQARRQVERVRRVTRGLCAMAAGLLLVGLLTELDYHVELPWLARALGLLVAATATIVFARRGLPRWTGAYHLEDATADLEARLVRLGQRVRTTVDYQDAARRPATAEPRLVRALEDDTFARCEREDFSVVVDARPRHVAIGLTAALALAWCMALATNGEWRTATGRTLLLPWQYTHVKFSPATATIKAGENVEVTAEIVGRPVSTAALRFRPVGGSGEWTTLPLRLTTDDSEAEVATTTPAATNNQPANTANVKHPAPRLLGEVTATLADCQEDLEFEVVAGPVPLPLGKITVLQPLELKEFRATATPPAYTGKPAESLKTWSFKVAEGTHVALDVQLSRAAKSVALTPVRPTNGKNSDKQTAAAEAASADSLELTLEGDRVRGELRDLRASGVWEFTARTADGIDLEPQRLAIRVQPDSRAKIRFLEPNEELEVIPTAEVPMVIEASDDLALVRVGIACRVAGGPLQTLWQQEIAEGTTEVVRGETTLRLEDFPLTFQDGVTYYAFADDKYFDEERRTATPLRFIDIRPFKMAYQMLDTGGS